MSELTLEQKIDKIYDGMYGIADNKQMGLIEMVHSHDESIKILNDIKNDGKKFWKIGVAVVSFCGFMFGEGIKHVVIYFGTFLHTR